jgi:membrane associated rhomboid family serine protease
MRKGMFVGYTGIIVLINAFVFLAYLFASYFFNPEIIKFLAIQPAKILSGQMLWTPLSSMFTHVEAWHLFANMISLIFIGGFVEKIIGKKRFIWLYFVGGIIASMFFVLLAGLWGDTTWGARMFGSPLSFAVGASGAIFALGGLLAVLTPKMKVLVFFIIPVPMWIAMAILTFVMWLFSFSLSLPIGNTAHLGGLIVGIVYGIYLKYKYPKKTKMISRYFGS